MTYDAPWREAIWLTPWRPCQRSPRFPFILTCKDDVELDVFMLEIVWKADSVLHAFCDQYENFSDLTIFGRWMGPGRQVFGVLKTATIVTKTLLRSQYVILSMMYMTYKLLVSCLSRATGPLLPLRILHFLLCTSEMLRKFEKYEHLVCSLLAHIAKVLDTGFRATFPVTARFWGPTFRLRSSALWIYIEPSVA